MGYRTVHEMHCKCELDEEYWKVFRFINNPLFQAEMSDVGYIITATPRGVISTMLDETKGVGIHMHYLYNLLYEDKGINPTFVRIYMKHYPLTGDGEPDDDYSSSYWNYDDDFEDAPVSEWDTWVLH